MRYYAIPLFPIPLNSAYTVRYLRKGKSYVPTTHRILTQEASEFKSICKQIFEQTDERIHESIKLSVSDEEWFHCRYSFLIPNERFFKKSKYNTSIIPERHDITNFFKLVEDSLFEYLETDDTRVISVGGTKSISERSGVKGPWILIKIWKEFVSIRDVSVDLDEFYNIMKMCEL